MSSTNNTMNQNNNMADDSQESSAISSIYKAFKDVHEASRATAQAEKDIKALQNQIKEDQATLDHRREIEANFGKIIQEQTAIVEQGLDSQSKIDRITEENAAKRTALVRDLDKTVKEHRKELEPFHTANEQAQAALDESARQLALFKRTEQSSRHQLETLINQRDKQTKHLMSSIETSRNAIYDLKQKAADPYHELSARDKLDIREKIAIEQRRLGEFEENLRRIETSAQSNIEAVSDSMAEDTMRLENSKSRHDEIKREAEYKLKRLEEKNEQCRQIEEQLQSQIDEIDAYQQTLNEHNKEIEDAIEEARELINEAHDIHDNPEVTKDLALKIMRNGMHEQDMIKHHEELEEFENELRRKTRKSRTITIVSIIIVVLLIVLLIVAYNLGWFA